jgi:hypothetical protein
MTMGPGLGSVTGSRGRGLSDSDVGDTARLALGRAAAPPVAGPLNHGMALSHRNVLAPYDSDELEQ